MKSLAENGLTPNPAVAFEQVGFLYEKLWVLENVSFQIFPGELIGIVGPNGEGKSTAMKLGVGLLSPMKGRVLIHGASPRENRLLIGYLPQTRPRDTLFPISSLEVVLTGALSHLTYLGFYKKETKKRAAALLDQLGIGGFLSTPFGQLSGGQMQKVLLARALIGDPKVLFLDEPTAHIDPSSGRAIFAYLKTLAKEKTIIVVTHHFDMIKKYTDRVLCFQQGVRIFKPSELCHHVGIGMYHSTETSL